MRKPGYNLTQIQEELYGLKTEKPTDLIVVYDTHPHEGDRDFAGIVALLPQAKPQRVRSAKAGHWRS
mgnify:CR=1 FL=1